MKKALTRTAICVALALCMVLSLAGRVNFQLGAPITLGNGQVERREMALSSPLKGAKTTTVVNIVIDPSLEGKVILEGESNLLDLLDAKQNADGVFEVGFKRGASVTMTKGLTAYIPAFSGGLLETTSTGNILCKETTLKGDAFELRLSSTGSIEAAIEAQKITARLSSTGSATLTGSAREAVLDVSGPGSYFGLGMKLKTVQATLSGPGGAQIAVDESLTGSVSGPGGILYDGDPKTLNVSGGRVTKK